MLLFGGLLIPSNPEILMLNTDTVVRKHFQDQDFKGNSPRQTKKNVLREYWEIVTEKSTSPF